MKRYRVVITSVAGVFVLGLLDVVSGYELGFFLFYFLPVAFVAWRCGATKGYLIAALCAAVWSFAEYHSGRPHSSNFFLWWNASIRFVAFLFVAATLSTIQRLLTEARAEVAELRQFLRVCAWCRKIATPQGQWVSMETFFEDHTQTQITHGICPECAKGQIDSLHREVERENEETFPPHLRSRGASLLR